MKPNRIGALLLAIIIVALWGLAYSAETVTVSARNWGPDSTARDSTLTAHFAAFVAANPVKGDISWLSHYTYTLTDSALWLLDASQGDPHILRRYYNATTPAKECPVTLIYTTISRHSPTKSDTVHARGWQGTRSKGTATVGPTPITAPPAASLATLNAKIALVRAEVNAAQKANKSLTRSAAWKLVLPKHQSELTDKGKAPK